MPANLTPEFMSAQKEYRKATDPFEKLRCLEHMLAVIPKHKGTEKMQADIKSRIKKMKEISQKQKGGRRVDFYYIDREGAGQIIMIGFPNTGKSSLLKALTNASPEIADYPYTTTRPMPGMVPFRKIQIQLLDTPPLTEEFMESWLPNIARIANAALLVVDLQSRNILEQIDTTVAKMMEGKAILKGEKVPYQPSAPVVEISTVVVANKMDTPEAETNLEALCELYGGMFPIIGVSAKTGEGLEELKEIMYDILDIIRIFTKTPGKPPELEVPYVLDKGSTVIDLANAVHKEIAENLESARVWGSTKFDGQKVQRDYILHDGDIVELNV